MPDDRTTENRPIELTAEQSREGEIGRDRFVRGPMRYVLIISTVLAIGAFVVVFLALR